MKRKRSSRYTFFTGALIFFVWIALTIQSAILIYEYILARTQNKVVIAFCMLGAILILSALCVVMDFVRRKYSVDRPVARILDMTERIMRGDFSARVEINSRYGRYTEFDEISDNLNAMAGELEKSEVLKNDFIANVSHEMKTPLAIMHDYACLLLTETDAEKRVKYAQTILRSSARLSELVMNVLKLCKLENGEILQDTERVNLTALLERAVLNFEERIEKKTLTVKCDLPDVEIVSSENLLELIFNNLVSNAVKFTGHGGRIEITMQRTLEGVTVCVADNGCGISKAVGARIFEKFYQGDTSHAREGNGLGLALVKKAIDVLGGEIAVESEEGKGSTFSVKLINGERA